jgi:hypothetical protein
VRRGLPTRFGADAVVLHRRFDPEVSRRIGTDVASRFDVDGTVLVTERVQSVMALFRRIVPDEQSAGDA